MRSLYRGLNKRAGISLLPGFGDLTNAIGDLGAIGAVYVIAASIAAGGGAGWLASKITARGARDVDTARKSYDNERLKADIGYLRGRISQEYDRQQRAESPRSARIIG